MTDPLSDLRRADAHARWIAADSLALRPDEPGNEILTPMAIVILFGLLSSTLLNMLLVPALFVRFGAPASASENFDSELAHAAN